jgi:hypothetical protein
MERTALLCSGQYSKPLSRALRTGGCHCLGSFSGWPTPHQGPLPERHVSLPQPFPRRPVSMRRRGWTEMTTAQAPCLA